MMRPLVHPRGPVPEARRRARGSALLLALWAIMILSLIVLTLAKQLDGELGIQARETAGLDARALAYSGAQVALHPAANPSTPSLVTDLDGGTRGWRTRLVGEGGRLNLNWLLAGEDQNRLDVLRQHLANRGLAYPEREAFIDSLLDWVDPDDVRRLNGNETPVRGPISNEPLQDLSELYQIPACDPLTRQDGWDEDFTLVSQGPIDLQWATESVLRAIPGMGDFAIRGLLQMRRGGDGEDGTPDDYKFKDLAEAARVMGLGGPDLERMRGLLTLNDPVFRIKSEGRSGGVQRTLEIVCLKSGGGAPQIILWKES